MYYCISDLVFTVQVILYLRLGSPYKNIAIRQKFKLKKKKYLNANIISEKISV